MTTVDTLLLRKRKRRREIRTTRPPDRRSTGHNALTVSLAILCVVVLTALSLRFDSPGLAAIFLVAGFVFLAAARA